MSRGPGVQQRLILDALDGVPADGGVWVTDPDQSDAQNVAARRAAHRLEELGKIKLIVQKGRLVAVRPDSPFKRYEIVGLDGKKYRGSTGRPMD